MAALNLISDRKKKVLLVVANPVSVRRDASSSKLAHANPCARMRICARAGVSILLEQCAVLRPCRVCRAVQKSLSIGIFLSFPHRAGRTHAHSKNRMKLVNVGNSRDFMKPQAKHATFGYPVGFWGSELTHPWLEFTESGFECTIASPQGGKVSEGTPSAFSIL
jgi:hypothetical protein